MLQILKHIPQWVYGLLAILVYVGWIQTRSRSMPLARAVGVPLAMLGLSAYGVIAAFRGDLSSLLAWAAVLWLTVNLCQRMGYPRGFAWDAATGRVQIPGSWVPMLLILSIFTLKLIMGIVLAMRPALALHAPLALPVSAVYGLLSGVFFSRGLRAWTLSRQISATGVTEQHAQQAAQ